eukprot:m.226117 g.226117  ORF g.226117 m.226117 type:complete len:125 (+) comp15164_c0_seq3:369-743(+)
MEPRDDSDKGRMKAAVHFAVGKILTRTQNDEQVRFSKATIATVTELLMNQVESMAQDLEAFAQHAKRSTVSPDDVLLLARRRGALVRSMHTDTRTHMRTIFVQHGHSPARKQPHPQHPNAHCTA